MDLWLSLLSAFYKGKKVDEVQSFDLFACLSKFQPILNLKIRFLVAYFLEIFFRFKKHFEQICFFSFD